MKKEQTQKTLFSDKTIPVGKTFPMVRKKVVLKNINVSVFTDRPFPRDRIIAGFMGSAGKEPDNNGGVYAPDPKLKARIEMLGRIVAEEDGIASSGAV